jgi:hypothetical protein
MLERRPLAVLERFFILWNGRDVGDLIALKGTNHKGPS